MTDTGQPLGAPENVALDNAADAFKSFLNPQPSQPRDETGRFAPQSEPDPVEEEEPEAPLDAAPADDGDNEDADPIETDEAADEAQPDAVEMPSSWSKDDAELWDTLPTEAKARIAEREAQRDQGLNSKLQESANARKAAEARAAEANAYRDRYASAIDEVVSLVAMPKPDPAQYGLGTDYYDRDAYDLAHYQWEQSQGQLQALVQQRQAIAAQQEQEAEQARAQARQEIEEQAWPKFLADVPELADLAKGRTIVSEVMDYAQTHGIPAEALRDNVTSADLHLVWKAMQYDRIKAAGQRVNAEKLPPKPAQPPVKPGGVTPRQTIQANRLGKAQARLAQTGSVDDAAAVFKHFLR